MRLATLRSSGVRGGLLALALFAASTVYERVVLGKSSLGPATTAAFSGTLYAGLSLLEYSTGRPPASWARALIASGIMGVAAFVGLGLVFVQIHYVLFLVEHRSLGGSLTWASLRLREIAQRPSPYHPMLLMATSITALATFLRLRGFRLKWQLALSLVATPATLVPGILLLRAMLDIPFPYALLGLSIIVALLLPLTAAAAEAVERRFAVSET